MQHDSGEFLRTIGKFCRTGGVVVTTTVSATSLLSELMRKVIQLFWKQQNLDFESQVESAIHFFSKDLKLLGTGFST